MSAPAAASDPQLEILSDLFPAASTANLRLTLRRHGGQVERAADDLLQWSEEQLAAKPESEEEAEAEEEKEQPKQREVHTMRIPLQQLRDSAQEREYTDEFELDGERWRLMMFPRGNPGHNVPRCFAAYLELRPLDPIYSLTCGFKMQMLHPSDPSQSKWREAVHTFCNHETDRGFNDLLTPATIAEYTHEDDCVVLNVSAWKAPRGF